MYSAYFKPLDWKTICHLSASTLSFKYCNIFSIYHIYWDPNFNTPPKKKPTKKSLAFFKQRETVVSGILTEGNVSIHLGLISFQRFLVQTGPWKGKNKTKQWRSCDCKWPSGYKRNGNGRDVSLEWDVLDKIWDKEAFKEWKQALVKPQALVTVM